MYSIYYQGEESSCGQNDNLNVAVLYYTNNSMSFYSIVEGEMGVENCPAGLAEQLIPPSELIYFTRQ